MGCSTRKYVAPLSSRLNFLCSTLLLFSLLLLRCSAFFSGKSYDRAFCHYPPRLAPRTNLCTPEIPICYGCSFHALFTHKRQCFGYFDEALNKNKSIRPNSGVSLTGGLFPSNTVNKNTCLSMGTSMTNGDSNEGRKSMIHRVWSKTIIRLWKAFLSILVSCLLGQTCPVESVIPSINFCLLFDIMTCSVLHRKSSL